MFNAPSSIVFPIACNGERWRVPTPITFITFITFDSIGAMTCGATTRSNSFVVMISRLGGDEQIILEDREGKIAITHCDHAMWLHARTPTRL